MEVINYLRSLLLKTGIDITHSRNSWLWRRKKILETNNINLVLDVGANIGQFAGQMRYCLGYKNKIISFEPQHDIYNILNKKSKKDKLWTTHNFALGDENTDVYINISENSGSSSIQNMLPSHTANAPKTKYIGKEKILVKKLDDIFNEMCSEKDNIYMKIDTQGYEEKVIKGADLSLKKISTIQVESSLIPLYEGDVLFDNMNMFMNEKGYTLISVEPDFVNSLTGQELQVDCIYHRF